MHKKEMILLDATLGNVIGNAAFTAELDNGHELVAFARKADRDRAESLRPGDRVTVAVSPFDMSKGCIEFKERIEQ